MRTPSPVTTQPPSARSGVRGEQASTGRPTPTLVDPFVVLATPDVLELDYDLSEGLERAYAYAASREDEDDAEGLELRELGAASSPAALPRTPAVSSLASTIPPPSSLPVEEPALNRKQRKRLRFSRARCEGRHETRLTTDALDYVPPVRIAQVHGKPPAISCDASAYDFARAEGAWIGKRAPSEPNRAPAAKEPLIAQGFRFIPRSDKPLLLVDRHRHIVVICAGRPVRDKSWDRSLDQIGCAVHTLDQQLNFRRGQRLPRPAEDSEENGENRRGGFRTVAVGISHGGGRTQPGNFSHDPRHQKFLDDFTSDPNVRRAVGFGNSVLAQFAPFIYEQFCATTRAICAQHPHLERVFRGSVFPAFSVNLGPRTVCVKHRDYHNLPDGMCGVMAGGTFDSEKGGELVLWELKVIIQFAAGDFIFFPSATITHENLPIAEGEERWSLTQYAAGGLFRWVEYGFQTKGSLEISDPGRAAELWRQRPHRWRESVKMFSKYENLEADLATVFEKKP